MAITPTDFADLTAVGTFIAGVAEVNALKANSLLNSGFVEPAEAVGAHATEASSVKFPEFDASAVVAATLPADGSAVADSNTVTEVFVDVPMIDKIVPYRYMPLATARNIDGEAKHLERVGRHIAGLIGNTIQANMVSKLVAAAATASQADTSGNAAVLDPLKLIKAIAAMFGENWDPTNFCIVPSVKVFADLLTSDLVMAAHKSSVADLSGRPLPSLLGMPIIACSDLTPTASKYKTLVLRRGTAQAYLSAVNTRPPTPVQGSGSMHTDSFFSIATHASRAGNKVGVFSYESL